MSLENNVTLRRKQLYKSKSIESVNFDSSLSNSDLDINIRSFELPNVNNNSNDVWKNEILQLRMELDSTRNELENVILDNNELRETVSRQQKQINTLKEICGGPLKSHRKQILSARKRSRRSVTDSLRMSLDQNESSELDKNMQSTREKTPQIHEITLENEDREVSLQINEIPNDNEHVGQQEQLTDSLDKRELQVSDESSQMKTNRLMIFADQTGFGVRQILQNYLGNDLSVTSVIKPYATMDEVLKSCVSMCRDFTKSDFILILAGSNDKSPIVVQSHLHYTLCQLSNTNVMIGNIYYNNFISVKMLNSLLHFVCCNCDNSTFIQLDSNFGRSGKRLNKLHACRLVLRHILRVKYINNYRNYKESLVNCNQMKHVCYSNVGIQTDLSLNVSCKQLHKECVDSMTQTDNLAGMQESDFFRE